MSTVNNFNTKEYTLISGSIIDANLNYDPYTGYGVNVINNASLDFIEMYVYNDEDEYLGSFTSAADELVIEKDQVTETFFIKPTPSLENSQDIINTVLSTAKYNLKYNFYQNHFSQVINLGLLEFYVDEISTSRREIRLFIRDGNGETINPTLLNLDALLGVFNENTCIPPSTWYGEDLPTQQSLIVEGQRFCYNFDYVLQFYDETIHSGNPEISAEENYSIINWEIDYNTSTMPSLVFKVNDTFKGNIKRLDKVRVLKEVFITQKDAIFYIDQDVSVVTNIGLTPDDTFTGNGGDVPDNFQSYNDISSSFKDSNFLENLLSGSDSNLHIDYNDFVNHTHFGSAASKLSNFRNKIGILQGYWTELSSSLMMSSSVSVKTQREDLFKKIGDVEREFTPFEKFLYNDGQSQTTASAPGLGKNLAKAYPITSGSENNESGFTNFPHDHHTDDPLGGHGFANNGMSSSYDGFNTVFQTSQKGIGTVNGHLFSGPYYVNNAPFNHRSGSVYLSFLAKVSGSLTDTLELYANSVNNKIGSDTNWESQNGGTGFENLNDNEAYRCVSSPRNASSVMYTGSFTTAQANDTDCAASPQTCVGGFLTASITASEWRRIILVASQSYWKMRTRPDYESGYDLLEAIGETTGLFNFASQDQGGPASVHRPLDIISGSGVISASLIDGFGVGTYDSSGNYARLLRPIIPEDTLTPRSGSFLPSGPLFWSYFDAKNNRPTGSYITDVNVTYTNPINLLPFAKVFHTGSTEFDTWYNTVSASAVEFDDNNIHSLKNNLPKYLREASSSDTIKNFLDMWGEHFDNIKGYIDGFVKFNKRGYKVNNSVPDNLLPILTENLGWDLIAPFKDGMSDYFESISDEGVSKEEVTVNTWRKVLNNLIYIYKSKGTRASIEGLLNSYGYPAWYITLAELQDVGDNRAVHAMSDTGGTIFPGDVDHIRSRRGGTVETETLRGISWRKSAANDRYKHIELDWMTSGSGTGQYTPAGVEFCYRTPPTSEHQILLMPSGTLATGLAGRNWALVLSGSGNKTDGKLELWLADTTKNDVLASKQVVMSMDVTGSHNDKYWNYYVSRDTSTGSIGNATTNTSQSYHIRAALQEGSNITKYYMASASIGGNHNSYSNQNFELHPIIHQYTGSGAAAYSQYGHSRITGNFHIGAVNCSGSFAELRVWNQLLSHSVFRVHTLNKRSITGNGPLGWYNDLNYHFKLNEVNNIAPDSADFMIFDSSVNDFVKSGSLNRMISGSWQGSVTPITTVKYGSYSSTDAKTDSNIIIDTTPRYRDKLNSKTGRRVTDSQVQEERNKRRITFTKSPNTIIDNHISEKIGSASPTLHINPQDKYKPSYENQIVERNRVLQGTSVNLPKFIGANKSLFRKDIINSVNKLLPAGGGTPLVGIEIKSDKMFRPKYDYKRVTYTTPYWETECTILNYVSKTGSYKPVYKETINIEMNPNAEFKATNKANIEYSDYTSEYAEYISPYIVEIKDFETVSSENLPSYSDTIAITSAEGTLADTTNTMAINFSAINDAIYEYEIFNPIVESAKNLPSYKTNISISNIESGEYKPTRNASISVPYSLSSMKPNYIISNTISGMNTISALKSDYSKGEIDIAVTPISEKATYSISTIDINVLASSLLEYNILDYSSLVGEYRQLYMDDIHIDENIIGQFIRPTYLETNYDIIDKIFTSATPQLDMKLPRTSSTIDYTKDYISNTAEFLTKKIGIINDFYQLSGSREPYRQGTISEFSELNNRPFLEKDPYMGDHLFANSAANPWGRGYNDTHFIYDWSTMNWNRDKTSGESNGAILTTGSDSFGNVYHHESRYVFHTIGFDEIMSGSYKHDTGSSNAQYPSNIGKTWFLDGDDPNAHSGLQLMDAYGFLGTTRNRLTNGTLMPNGMFYFYYSYRGTKTTNGLYIGRPVGKTSFFSSSLNRGDLFYPTNHFTNFGNTWNNDHGSYQSTLNTGSTLYKNAECQYEDLSERAFYTVEVSSPRKLKVNNLDM